MNNDKEMNYWPGFVDALSNVVLTLVFVLVVFVFALVFSSDKLKKRATSLSTSAQQEMVARKEAEEEKARLFQEQCELLESLQAARDQLRQLEARNSSSSVRWRNWNAGRRAETPGRAAEPAEGPQRNPGAGARRVGKSREPPIWRRKRGRSS
jgi:hypothetical protein